MKKDNVIFSKKISFYENALSKAPAHNLTVQTYFNRIKNGFWVEYVFYYRSGSLEKKFIPIVTPSGVFASRKKEGLVGDYTNLICLDLDSKDNPDLYMQGLRYDLEYDDEVFAFHSSISGNGLAIYVVLGDKLTYRDYSFVRKEFEKRYNIVLDKSTSDLARARFVSYDPDLIVNHNFEPFNSVPEKHSDGQNVSSGQIVSKSYDALSAAIRHTVESGRDITCDYDAWIKIGFALINEFGESGRPLFHLVSSNHPEYDYEEADKKYTSLFNTENSMYRAGFIFHLIKK